MCTCGQRSHQLLGTAYPATTAASIPSPSIVITSQPQTHLMFCRTIVFYIDRSSVLSPENDFIPGAFNSLRGSGMTEGKISCSSTNQEKSKINSSENRQKLSPLQKLFQTITKAMLFVKIAHCMGWVLIARRRGLVDNPISCKGCELLLARVLMTPGHPTLYVVAYYLSLTF